MKTYLMFLAAAGAVAVLLGRAVVLADTPTSLATSTPADAIEVHDDAAIQKAMIDETATMLSQGRTAPFEALEKQLDRKRCTLDLAQADELRLTPAEIYRRVKDGVLIVTALIETEHPGHYHGSSATGFALTASGAVATNYHVITPPGTVALGVRDIGGRFFGVKEILAADAEADVAILQLDGDGFTPLPLAADAPAGTPVTIISHPDFRFYALTHGVLSRYYVDRHTGTCRMAVTADFAKGSSGAPVIGPFGAAVGMAVTTESIYHDGFRHRPIHLQMVLRACVPAADVLKLIDPGKKAEGGG